MSRTVWGAMGWGAGLLSIVLAGCGPAPYSLDPPESPPPPVYAAPVNVVVAAPVAIAPPPLPTAPDIVVATVRRHYPKFLKCYEKALRHDRSLRGTIVVRVALDGDGDVDSARDWGGDLPDREVRECVIDVYEDIEFPQPAGSRVFVHPLRFEPAAHGGTVQ